MTTHNPETIACRTLGHSWIVRVVKGRLTELCSTCGAKPEAVTR